MGKGSHGTLSIIWGLNYVPSSNVFHGAIWVHGKYQLLIYKVNQLSKNESVL